MHYVTPNSGGRVSLPTEDPIVRDYLEAIESDLQGYILPLSPNPYGQMGDMIAYHLGWSEGASGRGKRIRPLLTVLSCAGFDEQWQRSIPAATAVELIHNFSLIHDDIQDNSETRRGRETVWKRWGIAQAMNTGDAIYSAAQLTVHRLVEHGVPESHALEVLKLLAEASLQLTRGQHLDLLFESQSEVSMDAYLEMVEGKTCSLLAAATQIGAYIGNATPDRVESMRRFGFHLGLAFQILDDFLGIWGVPEVTGKPSGDDLKVRKKTLPIIFGLTQSSKFRELWASTEINAEVVSGMSTLLEEVGAQNYVQEIAERHSKLAIEALNTADPRENVLEQLISITHHLLHRDR
jgi:geranylgeranyl diphosphate synthase type I